MPFGCIFDDDSYDGLYSNDKEHDIKVILKSGLAITGVKRIIFGGDAVLICRDDYNDRIAIEDINRIEK